MKKLLLMPVVAMILCLGLYSCKDKVDVPDFPESQPASINALRKVKLDKPVSFGETAIIATVTSDGESGNIDTKTIIVQDKVADAAIVFILNEDNQSFELGDEVIINLQGAKLSMVEEELQISELANAQVIKTGKRNSITPKVSNLATLIKNAPYWGPIVVKLDKINITSLVGEKLSGELLLDDEIVEVSSLVLPNASFSAETNPGFVEGFVGIVRRKNQDTYVNLRNLDDLQVGLKQQIEDFEQATSTDYNVKELDFITGKWIIDGGITASTASDPKNGKQSIRLQGSIGNEQRKGILEMTFDLTGVKSVSIAHGIYPASAEVNNVNPTVLSIQISKDGGSTFTEIGEAIVDTESRNLSTSSFNVNSSFNEKARFRVVNKSIPFSNNNRPRVNIDDFIFEF